MAKDRLPDKLAVILHADVAGSTQLVQQDEQLAHERIQDAFRRFSEVIKKYHGRVQEIRGDALLAEFERASDAVTAALSFQSDHQDHLVKLNDDIQPKIRIGIALGEVVIADNTITGAGVVLAQRVEQLATEGGICITGAINEALPQRLPFDRTRLGEQNLKGFTEPVPVYSIALQAGQQTPEPGEVFRSKINPARPVLISTALLLVIFGIAIFAWYRPWNEIKNNGNISIAVLPFTTIGSEDSTQRLAFGLTSDIVTDLSKFSEMEIIDNNTAAAFKIDNIVDLDRIRDELAIDYILDGTIQHEGDRMRISAKLLDVKDGSNLWSQRWDRPDKDAFEVQSELAEQVAATLGSAESSSALRSAEIHKARSRPPANLQAYDYYLLAVGEMGKFTEEAIRTGIEFASSAIAIDPDYARAYAVRARMHYNTSHFGTEHAKAMQAMQSDALKAVELDAVDPGPRAALAWYYFLSGRNNDAEIQLRAALKVNPANITLMKMAAAVFASSGSADEGAKLADKVLKLDPHATSGTLNTIKDAYYFAGRLEDTVAIISRVPPDSRSRGARLFLTFSLALLGRESDTERARAELLETYQNLSAELLVNQGWAFEGEVMQRFLDGFIAANIPVCATAVDLAKFDQPIRLASCSTN